MHTAHVLTVSPIMLWGGVSGPGGGGVSAPRGVSAPGGVCSQGGVCSWGGVWSRGVCSQGVSALGGVCFRGVWSWGVYVCSGAVCSEGCIPAWKCFYTCLLCHTPVGADSPSPEPSRLMGPDLLWSQEGVWSQTSPEPQKRVVRIILECFLVQMLRVALVLMSISLNFNTVYFFLPWIDFSFEGSLVCMLWLTLSLTICAAISSAHIIKVLYGRKRG